VNFERELSRLLGVPEEATTAGWMNHKLCPFCRNKKGKFGVNLGLLRYHCFRCGEKGGLEYLLKFLGIRLLAPLQRRRLSKVVVAPSFASLALGAMGWVRLPSPHVGLTGRLVETYLRGRGVDLDLWEVGVCEDTRLAGRAVFMFRTAGEPIYYQARIVVGGVKTKVLNPKPGEGCHRDRAVWGRDYWRSGMTLIVCEGTFDAIAATDLDAKRLGTCLMGKECSLERMKTWTEMGVQDVAVLLDQDAEKWAAKLAVQADDFGFRVRLCEWPATLKDQDPSAIGPDGCAALLDKAVPFGPVQRIRALGLVARLSQREQRLGST
jgi:hypothetical protein